MSDPHARTSDIALSNPGAKDPTIPERHARQQDLQRQHAFQAKERALTPPASKPSVGRRMAEGYRTLRGRR